MESLIPPVWQAGGESKHLLGTDHLGRDMLSRLIYGARVSVPVGLGAVFFAAVVGVIVGLVSGFVGGRTDAVLMRITDSIAAIPSILIMLAMIAIVGPGLGNVILVIALTYWTRFARMIRGEVLVIGKLAFVESAVAAGCRTPRLLYLHIFPNVVPTLTVLATLDLGRAIITEASLTFLGLGVQPPTAAWGSMLEGGRPHLATAWWIATLPGFAIMLTVLASNMLGDWLRDIFDPRRRGQ
jgi:peptide/nickel transport system permease protein